MQKHRLTEDVPKTNRVGVHPYRNQQPDFKTGPIQNRRDFESAYTVRLAIQAGINS